jgi:FG-GAP repeat
MSFSAAATSRGDRHRYGSGGRRQCDDPRRCRWDRFGFALAAGDVNGDGVADLIIGAPGADASTRSDAGAVYVFLGGHSFGSNATLDLAQGGAVDLTIYGAGERFGAAVATGEAGGPAGNTPLADMLIGAPGAGLDSPGAAYLVYGRAAFGSQTRIMVLAAGGADFTLRDDLRQHLGVSVAIGDFNGDHLGDLFAGAPAASRPDRIDQTVSVAPASLTGAVFGALGPFQQGGSLETTNAAVISFYGIGPGHQFGMAISLADLTGDGSADLVIGAPSVDGEFDDPATGLGYVLNGHAGAAFVFAGRQGLSQRRFDAAATEYTTTYLGTGFTWMGFAVGTGNYNVPGNADTIPDLLIGQLGGVRGTGSNIGGVGGVKVVFGGPTLGGVRFRPRSPFNPAPQPDEVAIGNPPFGLNTDFGFAVAAGDLNGDSSGDLVTALPFATVAGR